MLNSDHGDFVRSIERMNQMYRLQVSSIPTLAVLENRSDGSQELVSSAERLISFKKTLLDEIAEIDAIIQRASAALYDGMTLETALEILVAIADVTADLIVFCASEQRKFGIPPAEVMKIVMASNFSKLQPDGTAKYDEHGKFLKGPNYWKPEPAIRTLLQSMLGDDWTNGMTDPEAIATKPKLQLEAGKKYLNHNDHERGPMEPLPFDLQDREHRWKCLMTQERFRDDGGFYTHPSFGECDNDLKCEAPQIFGMGVRQPVVDVGPDHDPVLPRYARKGDEWRARSSEQWKPLGCDWSEKFSTGWDSFQFRRPKPTAQPTVEVHVFEPRNQCICPEQFCPLHKSSLVDVSSAPRYRPFASVEEFKPHRHRWLVSKQVASHFMRVGWFNDYGAGPSDRDMTYEMLFDQFTFDDGSPCGVPLPCDHPS